MRGFPARLLSCLFLAATAAAKVRIEGERFLVDGTPFIVAGVGYEPGTRPGQTPWDRRFDPATLERDLAAIRAAGFNTLRTWAPLTDEELGPIQRSGLKVLMGIWLEPGGPFGDPGHRDRSLDLLRREIPRLKKWPCILGYLILNEPSAETILKDRAAYRRFQKEMKREIRALGETRPVGMAMALVGDMEAGEDFDFVGVNLYPYNPATVKVLGYKNTLDYLRRDIAKGRPLVVTEFGLSVSPRGEGAGGDGGNTPAQQKDGVLSMLRDIRAAGIAGYAVFQWSDGWWKNNDRDGDALAHDPDPEEWFGLVGIEGPLERPVESFRPLYHALKTLQTDPAFLAEWGKPAKDRLKGFFIDDIPPLKRGKTARLSGKATPSPNTETPEEITLGIHAHDGWNPGRILRVPVDETGRFSTMMEVLPGDLFWTVSALGQGAWDVRRAEILEE